VRDSGLENILHIQKFVVGPWYNVIIIFYNWEMFYHIRNNAQYVKITRIGEKRTGCSIAPPASAYWPSL
jgi:hypothetical protein